jgi:hypothetical protein
MRFYIELLQSVSWPPEKYRISLQPENELVIDPPVTGHGRYRLLTDKLVRENSITLIYSDKG